MSLTKQESKALEGLRAKLASLADPKHEKLCVVSPEHKEAVRVYLYAWCLPIVEALIMPASERGWEQRDTLNHAARDAHRGNDTEWMKKLRGLV